MASEVVRARRRVVLAVIALLVASGGFAYTWYVMDGTTLVSQVDYQELLNPSPVAGIAERPAAEVTTDALAGIDDEIVTEVWSRQLGSQVALGRLLDGDIASMDVTTATVSGTSADVGVDVRFGDGTRAAGTFHYARIAGTWLLFSASGIPPAPGSDGPEPSDAALAEALSAVDRGIVATIVREHAAHPDAVGDLIGGRVSRLEVVRIEEGPSTRTARLRIVSDGKTVAGELVAVRTVIDEEPYWFVARLAEVGASGR